MNTTEFEKILNDTVVPAYLEANEMAKVIEPLQTYIAEKIPPRLYKYRSCCDYHIDAFVKDQIWASTGDKMNDGYDARMYFNKEECIDLYEKQSARDMVRAFITQLRTDPSLQEYISKLPGGVEALQNLYLPDDYICQGIEISRNNLVPIIMNMLANLPAITQQSMKFCSLSETVTSPVMWGHYSENESGFCIEYDFSSTSNDYPSAEGSKIITNLYPVIYKAERYQVPSDFINYLMQYQWYYEYVVKSGIYSGLYDINSAVNSVLKCPDIMMSSKIALYKSLDWQYEHEWRLFCNAVNDKKFENLSSACIIKRPQAIYLGRRITEVNEKILRMLADEKGIPVYKMKLDDEKATYDLKYE